MIYALTNGLLYLCFSILLGGSILGLIPQGRNIAFTLSRKTLILFVGFIPLLAVFPIVDLASGLNEHQEGGLFSSFLYVLREIETGKAWSTLLLLTIFYIGVTLSVKSRAITCTLSLLLVVGMVFTQGVVGHSSSMVGPMGAMSHIIHLMAVCSWAGILLVISWFAKHEENWLAFVRWFTIFAVVCMMLITVTGIFMSFTLTESIAGSWSLPYGQALLMKHLLFFALFVFAFINGFLVKKKVKQTPSFSPRRWWKAESVLVLSIFSMTGFMTEQEPPHDIAGTLSREGPSILFQTFTSIDISSEFLIEPNVMSVFFLLLAVVFFFAMFLLFKKSDSAIGTLLMSLIAVLSLYIALMNSVSSV